MINFSLALDAQGIAVLTWDMPGKSMNVINRDVIDELDVFVDRVKKDNAIKGAVITSGKPAFSGGADLAMLAELGKIKHASPDKEKLLARDAVARLGTIYRKLETCGKPFAAALNGTCLGGAFELALACHYRVATEDRAAKLGLPESKVGLLPGAGGTQRLPRLIGAPDALRLMLRGENMTPQEALRLGAIHKIGPAASLTEIAKQWIAGIGNPVQPWDMKDFEVPGGPPYAAKNAPVWMAANALYRQETRDLYDAQRAIMTCVYEGLLTKTIDAGLLIERDYFAHLMFGDQSKVMIRSLFHSLQDLNKGARRPKQEPHAPITRLGIVGGGFMGSGIAYASALAGLDVVLIDRDQAAAEGGKHFTAQLLDKEITRGRANPAQKQDVLNRIVATSDYEALGPCDLVIEAVFENRALKNDVWANIDRILSPLAIRASNTSTLPISSLAANTQDAARFIGIHFFSPVDKMQLVEIIMGKNTGSAALAKAIDYVRQIRKTPIVVNDSRGFYTSRVVMAHITEAHHMLDEGVPPVLIEHAGYMAGMPVGPLALADEIALDLQWKILQASKADLGSAYKTGPIDRILEEMVIKRERFGRKNRKGYYDYSDGRKKQLWQGINEFVEHKDASQFTFEALKERLLLIQALETARCFAENVLTDVREADVGAILGFGFAPFTGGPLSYIDTIGTATFAAKCAAYAAIHGDRYSPPELLIEMAEKQETFYDRFAA